MRRYQPYSVLVCLLGLSGCVRSGVSGKYLAKFDNGAYWLQLVETKDGHITGQFETVLLKPDGTVESNDWAVTGAADGKDVSLSIQPLAGLSLFSMSASGTLSWGKLHLTGELTGHGPVTVEFMQSDQDSFSREVASINARSRSVLLTRARIEQERRREQQSAELVKELRNATASMRRFEVTQQSNVPRFAAIGQRYAAITAKMEDYLNRERQLGRNPNGGVQRSQIVVALNQATIYTDQTHTQEDSAASQFQTSIGSLFQKAVQLEHLCRQDHPVAEAGSGATSLWDTCSEFLAALPAFREQFNAAGKAFISAEEKYVREHQSQVRILEEAQRIE